MENQGIMFVCGKCGNEVGKEDTICKKCGARLGNIRCPFCKFTGSPKDFKNDKCPKCGRNKNLSYSVPQNKKDTSKNKYQKKIDINEYSDEKEGFILKYFYFIFAGLSLLIILLLILFLKNFSFI